jgi:hypothetical protein
MNGQWLGEYSGSSSGKIIVNIDERESNYEGEAVLPETESKLPSAVAFFTTPSKENSFKFRTDLIQAIDPTSGYTVPWESIRNRYPENVGFSRYADVEASWDAASLTLSWITDLGTTGECVLPRSKAHLASDLVPLDLDWEGYKKHVSTLKHRQYLFRGQNEKWRLRTSFHRSGRAHLHRFLAEDIPALYKHLSAKTRHVFNLEIPDQNGAFFNLVQHHGYPTPLLDWTYSPYVAAFFAYRGITNEKAASAGPDEKVRIHVFDQQRWKADWSQSLILITPGLHLSIREFIAIENERMIPQQAVSTVTNIDDIETYIRSKETDTKKYLVAIDFPVRDRRQVVRELSYMGITAGALFPGLDGACEELRERHFEL